MKTLAKAVWTIDGKEVVVRLHEHDKYSFINKDNKVIVGTYKEIVDKIKSE